MSASDLVSSYDFVFNYLQPQGDEIDGSYPYLLITTTSTIPGQVSVNVPGLGFHQTNWISNQALLNITLPTSVYLFGHQNQQNKSIIVRSEVPISVHAMYVYASYRTTGFSVLPTTLLGQEYFVSSFEPHDSEQSEFSIAALDVQTQVTIDTRNTPSGGLQTQQLTLEPYQSWQFISTNDLTGARIRASRPVCVMSGATGVRLEATTGGPEYLIQNLLPVKNLGTRYVLSPFVGRTSGFIYRLIATEDNTVLNFPRDSSTVTLEVAGRDIHQGSSDEVVVVISNKPILVAQFAKSHHSDSLGDTFMLIIPPITSRDMGDITFPVTYLSTSSEQQSYVSVTVPCEHVDELILDDQATNWVDNRLEVDIESTLYCVVRQPVSPGVHKLSVSSQGKFPYDAFVYGFGKYVAYALSLWRDQERDTKSITASSSKGK